LFGRPAGGRLSKEKKLLDRIDRARLPRHIAIIMDGNGRWAQRRGLPRILELGAVEVSIQWRRTGIAAALLREAFKNSIFEEYIVIVCEFEQHWDLQGNKINTWNYQRMLIKLYGRIGFKKRRTDDPDIIEQPGNMLLVRPGKRVKRAYLKAFEELIYQQSLVE